MTKICDVVDTGIKGLWGNECDSSTKGIPVIKTNNLSYEGVIDYSDITYRDIDNEKAKSNFLRNGDILVEKSGGTKTHSVGYVSYFDGESDKYVCNNFILALRPKIDKVVGKFLFYQMRYMYENGLFSDCYNRTTGIQNLQQKQYLGKEIKLPPLSGQQIIYEELDAIVVLISNKKQQLDNLDELIKSQFVKMFENKDLPIYKFGDYVSIIDGDRGKNYPKADEFFDSGYCLFLNAKNVTANGFCFEHCQFISKQKDLLLRKGRLQRGDIVITTRGTIGNIAYYGNEITFENVRINSGMVIVRKQEKTFNPLFLVCAFQNKLEEIKTLNVTGAAQPQLPIHILSNIKIEIPPLELQNKFAEFVQKVETAKAIVKKQIQDLQELLDSKMDEYFG